MVGRHVRPGGGGRVGLGRRRTTGRQRAQGGRKSENQKRRAHGGGLYAIWSKMVYILNA
jgi:hypothetical protein